MALDGELLLPSIRIASRAVELQQQITEELDDNANPVHPNPNYGFNQAVLEELDSLDKRLRNASV